MSERLDFASTAESLINNVAESCENAPAGFEGTAIAQALVTTGEEWVSDYRDDLISDVVWSPLETAGNIGTNLGYPEIAEYIDDLWDYLKLSSPAVDALDFALPAVAEVLAVSGIIETLVDLYNNRSVILPNLETDMECIWNALPAPISCLSQFLEVPDDLLGGLQAFGACVDSQTDLDSFPIRIDPSGSVLDTNGNPISGATATLLTSPTASGPFTAVPGGSDIMDPSTNPEITDSNGQFHWEVFAGYYEVQATAAGCSAPGDSSQSTVTTPVLQVPPPQTGLVLTMSCSGSPPPPTPAVTGLGTAVGPAAGGTPVDIEGTGFTASAAIKFGSTGATNVTFVSPTEVTATAPPGSGTVDVKVTTAGGTSSPVTTDEYTYLAAPSVTSISPSHGVPAGGKTVKVTGTGFTSGDQVNFGGVLASSSIFVSSTQMDAVAPAAVGPNTVDVQVIGAEGRAASLPPTTSPTRRKREARSSWHRPRG